MEPTGSWRRNNDQSAIYDDWSRAHCCYCSSASTIEETTTMLSIPTDDVCVITYETDSYLSTQVGEH